MFIAAKTLARLAFAATLAGTGALAAEEPAAIDFSKYMSHSATLAAVVTAMSMLEPCSEPLAFTDEVIESYETVELTITCQGGENGEAAIIVRFLMLENGFLAPQSFEFAA